MPIIIHLCLFICFHYRNGHWGDKSELLRLFSWISQDLFQNTHHRVIFLIGTHCPVCLANASILITFLYGKQMLEKHSIQYRTSMYQRYKSSHSCRLNSTGEDQTFSRDNRKCWQCSYQNLRLSTKKPINTETHFMTFLIEKCWQKKNFFFNISNCVFQNSTHLQQEEEAFNAAFIQSFKGQQNVAHYGNLFVTSTCCIERGNKLMKNWRYVAKHTL